MVSRVVQTRYDRIDFLDERGNPYGEASMCWAEELGLEETACRQPAWHKARPTRLGYTTGAAVCDVHFAALPGKRTKPKVEILTHAFTPTV